MTNLTTLYEGVKFFIKKQFDIQPFQVWYDYYCKMWASPNVMDVPLITPLDIYKDPGDLRGFLSSSGITVEKIFLSLSFK